MIAADAFKDNTAITSITIPNSVTSIGDNAFYGCSGLTAVHISDLAAWCRIDFSNYYSNPLSHAHNLYLNGEKVTDLVIPYGVTEINSYAFDGCSGLTSVTIPNSVTSIGRYAFDGCSGLTSVTIGYIVTSIGDNAFTGCDIAKTIWLTNTPPSGYLNAEGKINYVANNQYSSFSNVVVYPYLSSLFEVDGIKYVPVSPAERTCDAIDCIYDTAMETVNIAKTVSYKNIVMNVKEVKPYTCFGNSNIKTLNISNGGSIDESAFNNCINLTSVTIGNSVTSIGSSAFEGCGGLTSVTIGKSVTSIGKSAFSSNSALNSYKKQKSEPYNP